MSAVDDEKRLLKSELDYHEKLYSGFAQKHFARPAVRALRKHMAARICRLTGANGSTRVMSLGCGIGDTELLLAPRVKKIVGVDLSGKAVEQATADAARAGRRNAHFIQGTAAAASGRFDVVMAIFFLHHLQDRALEELPAQLMSLLEPGGVFYSLDPSSHRLSGAVGRLLIPGLMKKYETEGERELDPDQTADLFRRAGFDVQTSMYDFGSSPLAGLFPGWRFGYLCARRLDDLLLKSKALRRLGSNFEIVARRP